MADRRDLEFTYSLIDRIFRLSLGELADFSGAKYDGDFSLSLEEAQRRKHEYVAEQIGIGPRRRVLDLGCGWGPLLNFVRERGGEGLGVTLSSAQAEACRRHGLDVHLQDARTVDTRHLRPLRRRRQPRRLRALLLARGLLRRAPGGGLPRPLRARRKRAAHARALLPADDGLRTQHDPDPRRSTSRRRATPTRWYLALMGRQFPGSLAALRAEQQIVRTRGARLPAVSTRAAGGSTTSRRSRQWRKRFAEPSLQQDAAQARLVPQLADERATSGSPSPPGSAPTPSASSASCSTTTGSCSRSAESRSGPRHILRGACRI